MNALVDHHGAVVLVLIVLAPFILYVLSRSVALGWFGAKLNYQRRLVDGLKPRRSEYGE